MFTSAHLIRFLLARPKFKIAAPSRATTYPRCIYCHDYAHIFVEPDGDGDLIFYCSEVCFDFMLAASFDVCDNDNKPDATRQSAPRRGRRTKE
jgi:hypothetical protein